MHSTNHPLLCSVEAWKPILQRIKLLEIQMKNSSTCLQRQNDTLENRTSKNMINGLRATALSAGEGKNRFQNN